MLAVTHYLATKPQGGSLICLVIAIVLFVIAAVVSFPARAWPYAIALFSTLIAAGLAFFVLAFLV
jgi:hypothetical protein